MNKFSIYQLFANFSFDLSMLICYHDNICYQATSGYKNHKSLISNTMLFWRNWPHFDKSLTNIISLICLARNGLRLRCNITLRNQFLQNKGKAKRGISPRLKKNCDLDLWPITLKITIFREDPSVQYQNHISWRKVQMMNFYVWMHIIAH